MTFYAVLLAFVIGWWFGKTFKWNPKHNKITSEHNGKKTTGWEGGFEYR
jgi:uncharacterized membrane protein YraQ (UPF0718 family)